MATAMYRRVVAESFEPEYVSLAHYHLHSLTGEIDHLVACNQINPCHSAARQRLLEAGRIPSSVCEHNLDCRSCRLGAKPG